MALLVVAATVLSLGTAWCWQKASRRLAEDWRCCRAGAGTVALYTSSTYLTLETLADRGDVTAQVRMGQIHERDRYFDEALHYYQDAAAQGSLEARYHLGSMYEAGRGVPQSDEEAVYWLKEAADGGLVQAQLDLGVVYESSGDPKVQNIHLAVHYYEMAAGSDGEGALEALKLLINLYGATKGSLYDFDKWVFYTKMLNDKQTDMVNDHYAAMQGQMQQLQSLLAAQG